MMAEEKEEVKCTYCGEKEKITKLGETPTTTGPIYDYWCHNCNKKFNW